MVRHLRGSYTYNRIPIDVSGGGHNRTKQNKKRCCHPYARKPASQAVLSRIRLTLCVTRQTPHGTLRLVQAMSAWAGKSGRAPFRHYRNARVYGSMTTAMHDMSNSPVSVKKNRNWASWPSVGMSSPRNRPIQQYSFRKLNWSCSEFFFF